MAAGALRPTVKGAAAELALSRRVLDFRYALPPAVASGYDMAGLSTYVDESGVVRYQPHNLLLWSRDLRNTAEAGSSRPWVAGTGTGVINSISVDGPLPGVLASRLTWNSETYAGRVAALSIVAGRQYTLIVYMRRVSGSFSQSRIEIGGVVNNWFGSALGVWERKTATFTAASTTTIYPSIYGVYDVAVTTGVVDIVAGIVAGPDPGGLPPETTSAPRHLPALFDNGRRGLRLEGPQTNPMPKTSELDNTLAWAVPSGGTVQANVATAPDGTLTADKLVEDTTNGIHYARSINYSIVAGSANTFTYSVKAAGRFKCRLFLSNTTSNSGVQCDFTLSGAGSFALGGLVGTGSGAAASIQALGNGWYDITISGIVDATSTSAGVFFYVFHDTLGASYLGNGTSGLFVWGHQPEPGVVKTSRIINTTTAAMLRPGAQQVISGAEFSRLWPASGAPSVTAFTAIITLADKPLPFAAGGDFVLFALNNSAGSFGAGHGLRIRSNGAGISVGGASADSAFVGSLVSGTNRIVLVADGATGALKVSVNGSPVTTLNGSGYTGVNAALALHRGQDSAASNGAGVVYHQTLEIKPPMSDAQAQAASAI